MSLNETAVDKACAAFLRTDGTTRKGMVAAIEAYMDEIFKPGAITPLEALPMPPARDYRKEAWIAALATGNGAYWADQVLQHFDRTFGEKP